MSLEQEMQAESQALVVGVYRAKNAGYFTEKEYDYLVSLIVTAYEFDLAQVLKFSSRYETALSYLAQGTDRSTFEDIV